MIYTTEFRAMGCQIFAALEYPSGRAERLLARLPEWFETWEAALSRFRPESELSRLNRSPGAPVRVSETLWHVFQAACQAEGRSQGLVTPTVLDALVAAGYRQSFNQLEADQPASQAGWYLPASMRTIRSDARDRTICLPPGVHLDFGGVAKGWAAHQVMKRLQVYGPALVNAGGDIAISSLLPQGEPWLVEIEDPHQPGGNLGIMGLGRCGVATSGTDYRRWKQGGTWQHHIIDPRSGQPSQSNVLSATVVGLNALEAEMAAKVALILGSQEGMDWLDGQPALSGMLVTLDGLVHYSRQFEGFLARQAAGILIGVNA
ncbi:MAG: FAD:protein FMN transferase [Chloroflexota bacterium]